MGRGYLLLALLLVLGCSPREELSVGFTRVPVIVDRDIAVARIEAPPDVSFSFSQRGLPKGALRSVFVRDSLLWVNLDGERISDMTRTFTLDVGARGYRTEYSGERELRPARAVRDASFDGVAAYRIPGLVTTGDGTLVACYDIRHRSSRDLQGDIDIGVSRSLDGGRTWEGMIVAMDMGQWGGLPEEQNGVGDPCILLDEGTGDLLLFAAWVHGKPGDLAWWTAGDGLSPEDTPQLLMSRSRDNGLSWSEPTSLTSQVKRPEWRFSFQGPGRGITMEDGTLVLPFQHQEPDRTPASGIIYSRDHGETWNIHESAKANTTESQVVELSPGVLMLNMRDNRGTGRAVYTTSDMGRTWVAHPSDGTLPEPVCMASLLKVPAGRNALGKDILLFSNPASSTSRKDIRIRLSTDAGLSWSEGVLLDEGEGWGYSCLTMVDDETVGILYESSQAHMTFQTVSLGELAKE